MVWLDDLPVGLIQGTGAANQPLYYIQADALGSPRTIVDGQRNVVVWNWPLTGEAFGKDQPNEDVDADGVGFRFDLRFPGQRYDAASGLNYNYFRDYEPKSGRYMESDPIGLLGGANTYAYVENDPATKVDQTGEVVWFVPIVISIGVGLAIDYGISKWKEEHCKCDNAETPAGPVGNAAAGAANGTFGAYGTKPRVGISGGGPSGMRTSVYSQGVTNAYQRGSIGLGTRGALRGLGRVVSKAVPVLSSALIAYELYDAYNCN